MNLFYYFHILLTIQTSLSIWPPPYKINLNHTEEFVIYESFGDPNDIYSDEELIKPDDIKKLNLDKDSQKYEKIHKYAMNLARKQSYFKNPENITRIKWPETNFDQEDDTPFIAGIFNSKDSNVLRENVNVFYYNEMAKSVIDRKIHEKRQDIVVKKKYVVENETDYDYKAFKKEYDGELLKLKKADDTLKFVNVKEEETAGDAVGKMINFKKPLNCTEEEMKGIGLMAIECLVNDLRNVKTRNKPFLLKRIKKIILIWFSVYLLIAIPLWCEKGWCCCCFQCKFCKPQLRIDEVKKFLADNPPGVLKDPKGVIKTYTPTHYEKYAQKRLEQAVMKL